MVSLHNKLWRILIFPIINYGRSGFNYIDEAWIVKYNKLRKEIRDGF